MESLTTHPDRKPRCRYICSDGNRCTAECLDAEAEIILCAKHAARAIIMARRRASAARTVGTPVSLGPLVPETLVTIPYTPKHWDNTIGDFRDGR